MFSPEQQPSSLSHDQRIEQLLLAGLDRYFAGEFEHAIQVWSRVFFLDRGHTRARAYIDRARGALAERQREAEARGYRGDGVSGGLADVAALGGRLELLDRDAGGHASPVWPATASGFGRAPVPAESVRQLTAHSHARAVVDTEALSEAPDGPPGVLVRGVPDLRRPTRARHAAQASLVILAALLLFGAGYVVAARDRLATWWAMPVEPALSVPAMAPETAAGPEASGEILERARRHLAQGRTQAALRALAAIGANDPLRGAADALQDQALRALGSDGGSKRPRSGDPPPPQGPAIR